MSLGSDVLQDLTEAYVVERAAAPALVNGRVVPAAPAQVTIQACIQPTSGRDLLLLEEEMRTRQTVTIFTTDLIRTADDAAGTPPDVVLFAGERYQVHTVQDWMALGGYYKGIALKAPR